MKHIKHGFRSFCVSVAAMIVTPWAWALSVENPETVEAFIDGAVTSVMQNSHSPSGVVMVMKGGRVILNKGYGFQDFDNQIPVDAYNTLFRPGSISKLFTWVAVLQLEEQGKLDLDADVNDYLTQFQLADTWPGQPVTLRHILTHTGGFEDGFLGYLIIDDPSRIIPLADALEKYQPVRVNPPGIHTAYSNWATSLAGLIVANVSGLEFKQYVQQHIFDVLGMKHASFAEPLPEQLDALMARHYQFEAGRYVEKPYEIIGNFGPAGALAASAGAMEKFARALLNDGELNGARILSAETVARFLSREFSHDPRTRGMGLGTIHYPYNGVDVVGHDGGTTGFVSHFGLVPDQDFMFFTSFSGPAAGSIIYQHLVWPFYDAFFPADRKPLAPPADFLERGARYMGTYHSWRNSFSKVESLLRLVSGIEVVLTDRGTLLIGGKEFVEESEHLFRELHGEARYVFQVEDDGRVTGMIQDGFAVAQHFKAPWFASMGVAMPLLLIALLIQLAVLLRWYYQRSMIRGFAEAERTALRVSNWVALLNWIFTVVLAVALIANANSLMYEVPFLLKFSLVFPPLIIIGAVYHLYRTVGVWRESTFDGVWARVRYSVVSLAVLFTAWFYYYWNLLGFNYFS